MRRRTQLRRRRKRNRRRQPNPRRGGLTRRVVRPKRLSTRRVSISTVRWNIETFLLRVERHALRFHNEGRLRKKFPGRPFSFSVAHAKKPTPRRWKSGKNIAKTRDFSVFPLKFWHGVNTLFPRLSPCGIFSQKLSFLFVFLRYFLNFQRPGTIITVSAIETIVTIVRPRKT